MRLRSELLAITVALHAVVAAAAPSPARPAPAFDLGDGLRGGSRGGRIEIWTTARPGEGWYGLSRRATGTAAAHEALAAGRPALREGQEVVLPREHWPPGLGATLLAQLFPKDEVTPARWEHVVTGGQALGFAESPWSLAALFTGDGRNHARLGLPKDAARAGLKPGDRVSVPRELLLPCWQPAGSAPAPGRPVPQAPKAAVATAAVTVASAEAPAPEGSARQKAAPDPTPPEQPLSFPAASAGGARVILRGSGGLASEGSGTLQVVRDGAPPAAPADEPQKPAASRRPPAEEGHDETEDLAPAVAAEEAETAGGLQEELEPGEPVPGVAEDFTLVPGTRSEDGTLTYALDKEGPHAVYRLRQGETLYSHVVLRFTGLLSGKDVNDAALRLARRSRIDDVKAIRVGTPVRIPLPDLLPQHLPEGHPRRVAWQQEQAESRRLANRREKRRELDGVHVLVDVGHGGADPGAGTSRVWEDDYAYDVACRVQAVLRERTRAVAHPLVQDLSSGHAPLSRIRRDDDEVLLTTPRYELARHPARAAVNLRWMLANSIRRKLVAAGVPEERIVFLSFHADSLHESARGAMAYFASAQYRTPKCGVPAEPGFAGLQEACDDSAFEMGRRDMLKAEGLSRALGESILEAVRRAGLPVHGFTPVRGSIVRSGTWVPAVLKYNRVQSAVLVEACNLNNPDDQKNLRDPAFRQAFAEAVVDGLESYFNGREAAAAPDARASR